MKIRRVIIVSKPHLDVGFTEMAAKVLHDNINWELFEAIKVARQVRPLRFTWTVPAYIAYEALERHTGPKLRQLEQAFD